MNEVRAWRELARELLNPRVELGYVRLEFTEPRLGLNSTSLSSAGIGARLWKGAVHRTAPPVLIYDRDDLISPGDLCLALELLDGPDVAEIEELGEAYPAVRQILVRVAQDWGWTSHEGQRGRDKWREALNFLQSLGKVLYRPVGLLKDPKLVRNLDWAEAVNAVVGFGFSREENERGEGVDPRLLRLREATFLRGVVPQAEPWALVAAPSGIGKSEFYELAGRHDAKVTANGLLGYAKSGKEIYPGSLDGVDLPYAIDQIDEQSAWAIARYLFDLGETGVARISTGGTNFSVRFGGLLIFLANPGVGESARSFGHLISKLTLNPSLGRRFGLIYYFKDAQPLKRKLSPQERAEWRAAIEIARAVEELARPQIEAIYADPAVWDWLNRPMDAWRDLALDAIKGIDDELVSDFLGNFVTAGQVRLRNAALRAAIFRQLKDLALGEMCVNELLALAEDLLLDYLNDVLASLKAINATWEETWSKQVRATFEALPTYLKEIISACEHARRAGKIERGAEIDLLAFSRHYTPSSGLYFSKIIHDVLRRNPDRHNERLKRFFGLELKRVDGRLHVIFHEAEPIQDIEPLGSWREEADPLKVGDGSLSPKLPKMSEKTETLERASATSGASDISGAFEDKGSYAHSRELFRALHWANRAIGIWREHGLSWRRDEDLREALREFFKVLKGGEEPSEGDIAVLFARLRKLSDERGLEAVKAWIEAQLRGVSE